MKASPSKPRKRVRKPKARKPTGRPPIYPWSRWFSKGRVRFTVVPGKDFTCSIKSMIWKIRNHASKVRKVSIRTIVDDEGITVSIRRRKPAKRK